MSGPILGVLFHWLGGLASGSFYVPFRFVRNWSWEVYWIVGGVFSWIFAPWILGYVQTENLFGVISTAVSQHPTAVSWAFAWGALWGLGGLTFGLTMRYLGMSLGMAVALGYCAIFGTLMPPLFDGTFKTKVLGTQSGLIILGGIVLCVFGIIVAGMAGMSKEREMTQEEKTKAVKEFNFFKGIIVATFSGILSSCMAYALTAAEPIAVLSQTAGTPEIWTGLPKLCVVLLGGFTSNFLWCSLLICKNKTAYQFVSREVKQPQAEQAPSEKPARAPMLGNYFFSALAGTIWYMQFFFYTMGETQMGEYKFSSWTLHMASIIIFSTLWGLALREWRGASRKTMKLIFAGLLLLVLSTIVVGYGNYVGGLTTPTPEVAQLVE